MSEGPASDQSARAAAPPAPAAGAADEIGSPEPSGGDPGHSAHAGGLEGGADAPGEPRRGPEARPPAGEAGAVATAPARPGRRPAPRGVVAFGRRWPRATGVERVFWAIVGVGCVIVLGLAVYLEPDASGVGTHEQLGLPPCGFVEMSGGVPCPSCGFTTTFTLAAHGRPLDALANQPFGFAVFLGALAAVPLSAFAALRGASLVEASEHWRWGRIVLGIVAFWLVAWLYKWLLLGVPA